MAALGPVVDVFVCGDKLSVEEVCPKGIGDIDTGCTVGSNGGE